MHDSQQRLTEHLKLLPRSSHFGKIKLDPLKVLAPYRKKITTLEAQRIIGVLEELKLKCEVVLILPSILKDLPKYKDLLGIELSEMLKRHSMILDDFYVHEKLYIEAESTGHKFHTTISSKQGALSAQSKKITRGDISATSAKSKELALDYLNTNLPATSSNRNTKLSIGPAIPSRARSRSASDSYSSYLSTLSRYSPAEYQMIVFKLNKLKTDLEFSVKNILRAFGKNEMIMRELLGRVETKKYKEGTYFLQCLADLKDMLMDRLLVTPLEQNEKKDFLVQVSR